MVQSGDYIFTPEFITSYKKIDLEECETLWATIFHPGRTTIEMILKLIFNGRSYDPKVSNYHNTTSIGTSMIFLSDIYYIVLCSQMKSLGIT